MKENLKNSNIRCCSKCGKPLWEFIDVRRIKILGVNGQEYEIGFDYINVVCKNCGTSNSETRGFFPGRKSLSELKWKNNVSEGISFKELMSDEDINLPKIKGFFYLDQYKTKILLQKLTEKERITYKIILDNNYQDVTEEVIEKIMAETKLPKNIIEKHTDKIIKDIKIIKGIDTENKKD